MINAQMAMEKARAFNKEQEQRRYNAMKNYADNELSARVEASASQGEYSLVFETPANISCDILEIYLNEHGFNVELCGNRQWMLSWYGRLPESSIK